MTKQRPLDEFPLDRVGWSHAPETIEHHPRCEVYFVMTAFGTTCALPTRITWRRARRKGE